MVRSAQVSRFRLLAFCCWLTLIGSRCRGAESNPVSAQQRAVSRAVFGYDTTSDFLAFDPQYRQRHHQYAEELRTLQLELARQAATGRATPCSRQIFLEARWLVYYSAQWDRVERRLGALRELLARPADPPDAREQSEADGSFDHCSEAWFLKLDSTVEEIEDRSVRGEQSKFPLRLLDCINSPEKLRAHLDSLLVSDVRQTGLDNRFELNITISLLVRLLTGDLGKVYPFRPDLLRTLFDYMDNRWQDPETGYFGGWYKTPHGSVRKTADLSVTFHIASYRRDSIQRVPEMMRTTLAFKDQEYPFGWMEEGQPSNHHNYDVVRLFRVGWSKMDGAQRQQARAEMCRMLDFCLKETLNPDGSFKLMDEDTLGSSFMIPVHLLDELGYFRWTMRFWTRNSFPDSMKVARRIENKIETLGLTDPESRKALRRLNWVQREHRLWRCAGWLLAAVVLGVAWRFAKRLRGSLRSKAS